MRERVPSPVIICILLLISKQVCTTKALGSICRRSARLAISIHPAQSMCTGVFGSRHGARVGFQGSAFGAQYVRGQGGAYHRIIRSELGGSSTELFKEIFISKLIMAFTGKSRSPLAWGCYFLVAQLLYPVPVPLRLTFRHHSKLLTQVYLETYPLQMYTYTLLSLIIV